MISRQSDVHRVVQQVGRDGARRERAWREVVAVHDGQIRGIGLQELQRHVRLCLDDPHLDVRELGPRPNQQRREQRRDRSRKGRDPHHALRVALQPVEVDACGEHLVEDRLCMCDQRASGLRQLDATTLADEELARCLALEHGELLRDGGWRQMQRLCGAAERTVEGDGVERLEPTEIEHEAQLMNLASMFQLSLIEIASRMVGVKHATAGWIFVGVTVVLWASAFPAIRVALESFGPAALSFLRAAVAAIALLVGARLVGVRRPARADLRQIALCGAAGIAAYQLLLNWGERTVTAGTASLLIATAPIYSLLIAGRLLGEPLPRRRWVGLGVALTGSAVVALSSDDGIALSVGALIVLAAAVVQGVYHVAQRPLLRTRTAYEVATYSMVAGALMLLPAAPSAASQLGGASAASILAVVFLGVGPSAIGFVAWAAAVGRLEVSRPALALYTVPAIAIFVAWWWLVELPTVLAVAGGAISIAGVAFGAGIVVRGRPAGADAGRRSSESGRAGRTVH